MTIHRETIGPHTLYLGDCAAILPGLIGAFDSIATDPPFGIGAAKANAHSSIRDSADWEQKDWDDAKPVEIIRGVGAMDIPVAIWGGNYFADVLSPSPAWLAWIKPEAETGFSLADMELCWTNRSFAARVKRYARRDGNEHPTQKPVAVMAWTLEFIPGQTTLDMFCGSGSTGVACVELGRVFIGIERDPAYFSIACRRIREAMDSVALTRPAVEAREKQEQLFGDADAT